MDASEVTEVCRLCPTNAAKNLLSVFDERLSVKNNMKEVILVTTGIEVLENDLVSRKICERCCSITLKMFKFRQDALKQDRALKEKCSQYLGDKGIRLPNTCITIKQERRELVSPAKQMKSEPAIRVQPSTSKPDLKEMLHPSITQLYQTFPHIKLPKTCVDRHMAPVVSLPMGQVEKYFKRRKLDMKQYICKPKVRSLSKDTPKMVAKKRTSMPTKKKTVAPLKISKQLFGNHKAPINPPLDRYICTPVNKATRKRSTSLSDTDKRLKAKTFKQSEHSVLPGTSRVLIETSKVTKDYLNTSGKSSTPLRLPSPPPLAISTTITDEPMISENPVRARTPVAQQSEDSRESLASKISGKSTSSNTTSCNESKPYFLESFGLTPTVTTVKSQTLSVCNVCGSVHNNAFELKRHTLKHMVCQFCKRRFKSLEAKQDHIDDTCEVKKIMNSPGLSVKLEPIHLNLDIRKTYKETFSSFEPIPGLVEPVEEVIVEVVSPPPPIDVDNIIVLSDDDDTETTDPLSDIPTPGAPPASETVVYNTVSIVKPDIKIKNNTILSDIGTQVSDEMLMKQLLAHLKPKKTTVEKTLQTDLPASKDIRINNSEGTCEFKNLKEQLLTYKVPIRISNGSFHVAYQFKNKSKPISKSAHWNKLPLVDVKKKTSKTHVTDLTVENAAPTIPNQSSVSVLVPISQQQPTAPVLSTTSLVHPALISNNPIAVQASSVLPPNQLLNNPYRVSASQAAMNQVTMNSATPVQAPAAPPPNQSLNDPSRVSTSQAVMNQVTMNSPTPLLHNYALSMAPARPSVLPRTYVNTPVNNRNMVYSFNNNTGYRPPLPVNRYANVSPVTRPSAPVNMTNMSMGYIRLPPSFVPTNNLLNTSTHTFRVPPPSNLPTPNNTASNLPTSTETSTFRVKNVWELQ